MGYLDTIFAKRKADKIVDNYVNGEERAVVLNKEKRTNEDGYVNLINRYGTAMDSSEAYAFVPEQNIIYQELEQIYEGNGLFAKIIDTPAAEATKNGFELTNFDEDLFKEIKKKLYQIGFEDEVEIAIQWARLFGGALMVMLIDDGGKLEEPVNWKRVKGIEEVHTFESPLVSWNSADLYNNERFGVPELFEISSECGSFKVHHTRCLIFRNGRMPESSTNANVRFWGIPEYTRIRKFLQEAITSSGFSVKMLERSVQAIYSVKDLAELLQTEAGEDNLLKRLQAIDLCRGILNTIAVDAEGESFDYRQATFTGVQEVVEGSLNLLSAVTNIPQTVLFGRSPAGMNATGEGDLENYYNFVQRIQNKMLKRNYEKVIEIILYGMVHKGKIKEIPEDYELEFNPLWSLDEQQQTQIDLQKAQIEQTKAATAQAYVDMQALDPAEVRAGLAASETYDIETLLDSVPPDKLFEFYDRLEEQQAQQGGGMPGGEGMPGTEGEAPEGTAGGAPMPDAGTEVQAADDESEESEVVEEGSEADETRSGYSEEAKKAARLYLKMYAQQNPEEYEEHKKDLARGILKNFAIEKPEEYEERKKTLAKEVLTQFAKENPEAHQKRKEELAEELLKERKSDKQNEGE